MSQLFPPFNNGLNAYANDLVQRAHAQGYQEGMREGIVKAKLMQPPIRDQTAANLAEIISRLHRIEEALKAMPLKPRTRVKANGIPIGSYDAIADDMGRMKIKPKRKARSTPQEIASRKRKKWRAAK